MDMTSETIDTDIPGGYRVDSSLSPYNIAGVLYVMRRYNMRCQFFISSTNESVIAHRYKGSSSAAWSSWVQLYNESILTDSTILSPLASALKPYLDAL